MKLLPKVKGKQPLRTVGELRQFMAKLDDSVLLTSFSQYFDETLFPVVAEIEKADKEAGHWFGHKRLHISGYERYSDDPELEDSWKDVEK